MAKRIHSQKDIEELQNLESTVKELCKVAKKFPTKILDKFISILSNKIAVQLYKYEELVGTVCYTTKTGLIFSDTEAVKGTIVEILHFSAYDESVMVLFKPDKGKRKKVALNTLKYEPQNN